MNGLNIQRETVLDYQDFPIDIFSFNGRMKWIFIRFVEKHMLHRKKEI